MKNFKRIIALCLVIALSAIMLASCNSEKSRAVATYDGDKYVYEDDEDFLDFYNLNRYFYAYETGEDNTDNFEYNKILSNSVKETIIVRVFEEEIKEKEYTLDMNKVYSETANDIASFDSAYSGGFNQFCKDWDVSENVFLLYNKYEAMKELAKEFVTVHVSESEAKKYYDNNPEKYFKTPHYDVQTLYLQVADPSNEAKMNEAYHDAMIYIGLLNGGRSWESVKQTALLKYNANNGAYFTEYLSQLNHVSMKYFLNIMDLETALNSVKAEFEEKNGVSFDEMFPAGFEAYAKENKLMPETKEYNEALELYMNYASKLYNIEFEYAIKTEWEGGKTYHKPVYHAGFNSYVILTFTRIEEEDITITFEEAKESIIEILTEQKKDKAVENYISERIDDLKVQIEYK